MTDTAPANGPPAPDQRGISRLVAALRADGDGVAALAAECHRDVPDVGGVVLAVLAAHAGRIIVSDSGPDGDQLEDLHATFREGPGIDAAITGRPVTAADLDLAHATWPRFAAQAVASGIRAVFAFPVIIHAEPAGVLSLYRAAPGPLSDADRDRVGQYVRAAGVLLLDQVHVTGPTRLSTALPSKAAEVQQAVGALMEHADIDAATALHRLRAYAHRSRRSVPDVAAQIRTGQLPFDPTTQT